MSIEKIVRIHYGFEKTKSHTLKAENFTVAT